MDLGRFRIGSIAAEEKNRWSHFDQRNTQGEFSMKSSFMAFAVGLSLLGSASLSWAQSANHAIQDSQVRPASFCEGCGGYSSCDSGTIWGSSCCAPSCGFRPGLLPPCPNPCRTTFLADMVCGLKNAVDTSVSHVLGSVFSCCNTCGSRVGCGCDGMMIDSGCGGCDAGYVTNSYESMGQPTPAATPAPLMETEPAPPAMTGANADPFIDDAPNGTSSRSVMQNRSARGQVIGGGVRRMSYEEPVTQSAKPRLPSFFKNYDHQREVQLRKPNNNQVRSLRR